MFEIRKLISRVCMLLKKIKHKNKEKTRERAKAYGTKYTRSGSWTNPICKVIGLYNILFEGTYGINPSVNTSI